MLAPVIRKGDTIVIQVEKGVNTHRIVVADEYFPEFARIFAEALEHQGAKVEFQITESFI